MYLCQVHLRAHADNMSYCLTLTPDQRETKERQGAEKIPQVGTMKLVHSSILTWGMTGEENKYDIWFEFPFPSFGSRNKDTALLMRSCQPHLMEKIPVRQKVFMKHLLHFCCTGKQRKLDAHQCLFFPDEVYEEPISYASTDR